MEYNLREVPGQLVAVFVGKEKIDWGAQASYDAMLGSEPVVYVYITQTTFLEKLGSFIAYVCPFFILSR